MVLLNDFKRQWEAISPEMIRAFERVGQSGYYILGPEVAGFEQALASYWGLPHAVGVANGMDAIEIALRALGVSQGDRVLTTPLTAFATTLAILRVGATPVFCDVDGNGLMDLTEARRVLLAASERGAKIRAMVPVHLYGHCLDLDALESIQKEFGLLLVEDCAQSIGANWQGRPCGSVGSWAATSFYPTKNLGCMGDGGALLSRSSEQAELAKCLRHYGQRQRYNHAELGLNSRLDELQAALLKDAILPRLKSWTERRRQVASRYLAEIKNPTIRSCRLPEQVASVWHLFPVFVSDPKFRPSLEMHLKSKGVQSGCHYPILVQDQQAYCKAVDSSALESSAYTPRALQLAETELSLPIHPFITDAEVAQVIEAVNCWRPSGS